MEEMVLIEEVNEDVLDDWSAKNTLHFDPRAFSERATFQTSIKSGIEHKYDTTSHAVRLVDTHRSPYTLFPTSYSPCIITQPCVPHIYIMCGYCSSSRAFSSTRLIEASHPISKLTSRALRTRTGATSISEFLTFSNPLIVKFGSPCLSSPYSPSQLNSPGATTPSQQGSQRYRQALLFAIASQICYRFE